MSVVFLVQSEEQLRSGGAWCSAFAEAMDSTIVPVVLGKDRQVLEKHAETVVAEQFRRSSNGKTDVRSVAPEAIEILKLCEELECRLLVILTTYTEERTDWQKKLFETSTFRTAWLCPASDQPPHQRDLVGGFHDLDSATNRLSMKLLGMRPGSWVVDRLPSEKLSLDERVAAVDKRFDDYPFDRETLILVPIQSIAADNLVYRVGQDLLDHCESRSVVLVREGQSVLPGLINRFRRWTDSIAPPLSRSERIELQEGLESGSRPGYEFLLLISAASMLASFGLLQNSAAVIIGAMLIAPLMTPIMGAGLAIALGNRPLFRTSFLAITLGVVCAFAASAAFGLLVRLFESPDLTPEGATEMWARCNPSPIDFCVGLVGGMAAAYARTRSHLSSALAGAAIAAALIPPISTAGLQAVFAVWPPNSAGIPIFGPLMVVSINVLTIMIGSSFVLWSRGIRAGSRQVRKQDRWAIRAVLILVGLILLVLVWIVEH